MNNEKQNFFWRLWDSIHPISKGVISTVAVSGMILMMLGIDFRTFNKYTEAKIDEMRQNAENVQTFDESVKRFKQIIENQNDMIITLAQTVR